jgi:homoserine dehydrogenase
MTEQQISDSISKQTQTTEPVKVEEVKPVEIKEVKPTAEQIKYTDDTDERKQEIVANLQNYALSSPQMLSNIDTFKNNFSFNKRSQAQQSLLLDWYS